MNYLVKFKKNSEGFSLVEIIIVVSIFSIFIALSDSVYTNVKKYNSLKIAVQDTTQSIRYAQSNAQKGKGDGKWGVKINEDKIIIFKGDTYNSRDSDFDQSLDFSGDITTSGLSEIVFEKITGITDDIGTTTVFGSAGSKEIYINEKGTITY